MAIREGSSFGRGDKMQTAASLAVASTDTNYFCEFKPLSPIFSQKSLSVCPQKLSANRYPGAASWQAQHQA